MGIFFNFNAFCYYPIVEFNISNFEKTFVCFCVDKFLFKCLYWDYTKRTLAESRIELRKWKKKSSNLISNWISKFRRSLLYFQGIKETEHVLNWSWAAALEMKGFAQPTSLDVLVLTPGERRSWFCSSITRSVTFTSLKIGAIVLATNI